MRGKQFRSEPVSSSLSASREERDARQTRREIEEVAQAMVAVRKQAGMTQRDVADAIGTQRENVARLESGRHAPSVRMLQKFARVTNMQLQIAFAPYSPVPKKASQTMTDTLNRPNLFTDRRHFLGGAMGLAGLLGLGNIKHVTAQEATAAAEAIDDYVWTPIEWGEERALFTVIDRGEETTFVETLDGQFEIPSNPQRIVVLDDEQIAMFEIGMAENIIGLGYTSVSETIPNAGDLTEDIQARFADVPTVGLAWELDVEQVMALEPDLILGNSNYQQDEQYEALTVFAPFIRKPLRVTDVPRAAVRDFGALFGVEETAAEVLADHEAFIARARETVAPFVEGKRILVGTDIPDTNEFWAVTSHYIWDGEISVYSAAYPAYRELGLTPTSFVEVLASQDREAFYLSFSLEEFGKVDADIVLYLGYDNTDQYEAFLANPIAQTIPAYENNAIYFYDDAGHGDGLAGRRSAVKWMVETLTGEPFE